MTWAYRLLTILFMAYVCWLLHSQMKRWYHPAPAVTHPVEVYTV